MTPPRCGRRAPFNEQVGCGLTAGHPGDCGLWEPVRFNGPEYVPARDDARLSGQLGRVFSLMRDAQWRTLDEISTSTGDPAASVSAQLRHLRKPRFGAHTVERRSRAGALYEYRLLVSQQGAA